MSSLPDLIAALPRFGGSSPRGVTSSSRRGPSSSHAVRTVVSLVALLLASQTLLAGAEDVDQQRLDLMRARAMSIRFFSPMKDFPAGLEPEPLFRYDDVPRGYVDGTVWRLGKKGRPLAIITTELHPKYLGGSGRVVYDFLSLSPQPFSAKGGDVSGWTPPGSAVEMKRLANADPPLSGTSQRLFQMKRLMQRFVATQIVSEEDPEEKKLSLRLLPRPIDRYRPDSSDGSRSGDEGVSDGAAFLFVAGRMPGVILFLEADGDSWRYGVGRLSAPSTLQVKFDDVVVWEVPPGSGTWSSSYVATNATASIPGSD